MTCLGGGLYSRSASFLYVAYFVEVKQVRCEFWGYSFIPKFQTEQLIHDLLSARTCVYDDVGSILPSSIIWYRLKLGPGR